MFTSIKSKLIVWVLSTFSIIFTVIGIFIYYELNEIVIGTVDRHLHNEIELIAGLLRADEAEIAHELSEVAVGEYAVPLSGHYYQIVSSDGKIIASSPSISIVGASLPIIKGSSAPSFKTIVGPEKWPLRLITQSF